MDTKTLLRDGRNIWGDQKLTLSEIIVRLNVSLGDLARIARNSDKDRTSYNREDLERELGNIIFSTIRWCDDLGLDPEICIEKAKECQKRFAEQNPNR